MKKLSLLQLSICFVCGLACASVCKAFVFYAILLISLSFFFWLKLWEKRLLSLRYEIVQSLCIHLLFYALGGGIGHQIPQNIGQELAVMEGREICVKGVLLKDAQENMYGRKLWLDVKEYEYESEWKPLKGKLVGYLKEGMCMSLYAYDEVELKLKIRPLKSRYPSYLAYLKRQGLSHSAYIRELKVLGREKSFGATMQIERRHLGEKLADLIEGSDEASIAQAMLLGEKQYLERELKGVFADAGVSHILAISGLHVGIIFLILNYGLGFLTWLPRGGIVKNMLVLALLIAYAILVGGSAAVVRAVMMFGVILVARSFAFQYHSLNLVAFAALLQLVWRPEWLFDVGFQLSYSAVLGIIWLYPKLEKHSKSRWKWLNIFHSWILISFCAQLFTLPFVLYYFERFPTYFLLSNVLLSTLSFLCVLFGFLTLVCAYLPYINELLGWVSYKLLGGMQWVCEWVASLPYASLSLENLSFKSIFILILELLLAAIVLFSGRIIEYFCFSKRYLPENHVNPLT